MSGTDEAEDEEWRREEKQRILGAAEVSGLLQRIDSIIRDLKFYITTSEAFLKLFSEEVGGRMKVEKQMSNSTKELHECYNNLCRQRIRDAALLLELAESRKRGTIDAELVRFYTWLNDNTPLWIRDATMRQRCREISTRGGL